MAIVIYGSPRSRTMRVLWMASELELAFRHIPHEHDSPALKTPGFLELNPAGSVPTLVDDGFALSESLAINLYLSKKYGSGTLYPLSPEDEASAIRWSLFAQGHLEPWIQQDLILADLIDAIGPLGDDMVYRSLGVLNRALTGSVWLLGDAFSVADLNVAGVLSPSRRRNLDLSRFDRVATWLDACYARPAAIACRKLLD